MLTNEVDTTTTTAHRTTGVRRRNDRGTPLRQLFEWEADRKHGEDMIAWVGLTPGGRDVEDELGASAAAHPLTHAAGTGLQLSIHRTSILFAMSSVTVGMSSPAIVHRLQATRLGRYVLEKPSGTHVTFESELV